MAVRQLPESKALITINNRYGTLRNGRDGAPKPAGVLANSRPGVLCLIQRKARTRRIR
jgi:hypothetical protein